MKVMTVVGARPQFVKAAVLSRAFHQIRTDIVETLVHTGQHYDENMSEVFFSEMDIRRPSYNLAIGGGTHGQNTGRMIEALEGLADKLRPDWMVVFGDTDSTLAASLAASKIFIPIAHVEAGLRSFNRRMPEEINRVLTDHLAERLYAPTATARDNLLREGIDDSRILISGDVMYDAAIFYRDRARAPNWLASHSIDPGGFALCTIHRAENTDDDSRLRGILAGLADAPLPVVLPLHPRTRARMKDRGLSWPGNVVVVEPVGYLEMVWLEVNCSFILTDSGGVQKEAYFHGKPCITLRNETEWVELVNVGWNRLVGSDARSIAAAMASLTPPSNRPSLYGDGDSGRKIVESLR